MRCCKRGLQATQYAVSMSSKARSGKTEVAQNPRMLFCRCRLEKQSLKSLSRVFLRSTVRQINSRWGHFEFLLLTRRLTHLFWNFPFNGRVISSLFSRPSLHSFTHAKPKLGKSHDGLAEFGSPSQRTMNKLAFFPRRTCTLVVYMWSQG